MSHSRPPAQVSAGAFVGTALGALVGVLLALVFSSSAPLGFTLIAVGGPALGAYWGSYIGSGRKSKGCLAAGGAFVGPAVWSWAPGLQETTMTSAVCVVTLGAMAGGFVHLNLGRGRAGRLVILGLAIVLAVAIMWWSSS